MTIIGSASIQIRADDKYFEPDVRRAVGKIKNVAIQLKADVDISAASKKIRDLRYRITSKDAVLGVDADTKKAEAKIIRFMEKYLESEVVFRASADTKNAQAELDKVAKSGGTTATTIVADADTAAAETQLAFAARPRTAPVRADFKMNVDKDIAAAMTGAFNTLTGTLPFETIKSQITGVIANFESLAVGAAKAAVVVGSLGAALLTTAANAVSVAADITQLIGLLSFMPIAVVTLNNVLKANKFAWEGFGAAAKDNSDAANKALEKLPPIAQEAAIALRGLREELQSSVQESFWYEVGTSLQDMMSNVFPQVEVMMSAIGAALGGIQRNAFDAASSLADVGSGLGDGSLSVIETTMGNISKGLLNASDAGANLTLAFASFAEVGSTYLPSLGTYINDLTDDFREFAETSKNNGDMKRWMDDGIQRAQELGTVVASTADIFGGLARASRASGAPGLTELANGFARVAEIVNGEPFQSRLITVLEGARLATDYLGQGFSDLVGYIGESSQAISIFLAEAGKIGGIALSSIQSFFDGTGLGSGLMEALYGFEDALTGLQPGFRDLGIAVGDLGEIAGALFRELAPGLNILFETIRRVIGELKQGIMDAMPVFNEFMQAVIGAVSDAVVPLASAIGDLLTGFSQLPGPIQTVLMALGGFLLLKGKFGGFFDQFRGELKKVDEGVQATAKNTDTRMGAAYKNMRDGALETSRLTRDSFSLMGTGIASTMQKTGEGVGATFRGIGDAFHNSFSDSLARTQSTIVGGMGAVMSQATEAVRVGAANMGAAFSAVGAGFKEAIVGDSELGRVREGFDRLGSSIRDTMAQTQATVVGGMGAMASQAGESLNTLANRIAPVGSKLRNLATDAADTGRMIASGIGEASSSLRTLGGNVATAAGQMGANLAPARAAFSDLAKHMTSSVGGAASRMGAGLVDALGGGWGAAIAGATIAIAAYAKAAAESKARVEELSKAIDVQSGAFEAAGEKMLGANLMDGATTGWDDFFRGVINGSKSTEEIVENLGTTFEDIGKKLADSSGRDKYVQGWEDIAAAMSTARPVTQDMADAVGLSIEQLEEMNTFDATYMTGQIKKIADEAERAEIRAKQLGQAFDTSDVAGAQMARNFDVLGDAASSVSEKVAALKSNLDLQSGGAMTAATNATNFAAAMFSIEDSVASLTDGVDGAIDANGRLSDSFRSTLTDSSGMFSNATRDSVAFSQSMQTAADAVLTSGVAEMQRLRDSGVGLAEAQAGALVTMNASTETLRASLTNMGFDAGQVQVIIDQLKLNPDNLKAALVVESGDAESKLFRIELLRAALVDGDWELALTALTDEAKASIEGAGDIGKAYAAGDYEAVIKALNEADVPIAEFMLQMSEARNDAEREMVLKATFGSDAVVSETKDKLYGIGKGLTPAELTADWLSGAVVQRATGDVRGYGDLKEEAELLLKDSSMPILTTAKSNVTTWGTTKANAEVGATDRFTDVFFQGKAYSDDWSLTDLKPLELMALDMATPAAASADAAVGVPGGGGGFFGKARGGPIDLSAMDNATAPAGAAKASVEAFDWLAPKNAMLNATDNTAGPVGSAKTNTQSLTDVFRGLFANDNTAGAVGGAQGTMSSLMDVWRGLFANNNTGGTTAAAQGTMGSLVDVTRSLLAQNLTGGTKAAAQGTMNSLVNVTRDLLARNQTGGTKAAAQGTLNSLVSVTRDLLARNLTGGPKADAQGTVSSLQGKTVDLRANDFTGGAVASAKAAIGSVVGKTVDIVSRFLKIGDNADGGVWKGGQRAFADGGIMGGVNQSINRTAVKAFAGGGIENHTAQIAKGAWPVRVWAEPETGGEAYIPLSPSKRKRSLSILKYVMAEFGIQGMMNGKAFADGGINMAGKAPSVVSQRYAVAPSASSSPVATAIGAVQQPVIAVYPSQGLSEAQIGESAAKEWFWQATNK